MWKNSVWADLEKTFFCELWNFGNTDFAEKGVNDEKLENATKHRELNIYPKCILFFLLTGDNDITMPYE